MSIDVVIIGLNCAATLGDCLRSALGADYQAGSICVIYVDSGSTDDSVSIARGFPSVVVLELDAAFPSPGGARNLGWRYGTSPLVQFLDSDTVMNRDWLRLAIVKFTDKIGAVRGLRQERYPERSVFNWIADREWNAPAGDCDTFGGDALIRRDVLVATGGYDEELVGGEDPELSERVRQLGWRVLQVAIPMTLHDLAMYKVAQYWKRAYRTGYGYAAVTWLHSDQGFWIREVIRILVRGGVGPAVLLTGVIVALLGWTQGILASIPGFALLFHPLILRRGHFRRSMALTSRQSLVYALHCSLVVIPECFGVLRYWIGEAVDSPLRNSRASSASVGTSLTQAVAVLMASLLATGCTMFKPGLHDYTQVDQKSQRESFNVGGAFQGEEDNEEVKFANESEVADFSNSVPAEYLIGAGDVMSIVVRGRPDVTLERVTVSPDGRISVPLVGIVEVSGQTVGWLTEMIKERLSAHYKEPDVTILMNEYHNNKVFVLGRVDHPGLVNFKGNGTLLEAIAMAGGMSTTAQNSFLSRAVIFRGKEMVIWVDLMDLLNNGNMALNARLRNNDLVFIPESHDELIYVMGQVATPGAIKLTSQLSLLDVVMMSGGPTMDAKIAKIYIIRYEGKIGAVQEVSLEDVLGEGDLRQNYILRDGDIVYVSAKALKDINYVISSLSPSLSYLNLATTAALASGGR